LLGGSKNIGRVDAVLRAIYSDPLELDMNNVILPADCGYSKILLNAGAQTHRSRVLLKLAQALRCMLAGAALTLAAGAGPSLCEEVALLPPSGVETPAVAFERTAIPPPAISGERRDFKALWRDPAIRNYVGLSENAWDFNAPGGVPGFGLLDPKQQD
jgi:hypothetical protein